QLGDGALQVPELKAATLVRRPRQHRLGFAQSDGNALAYAATDLIHILIMEDGKQPGAQIGPFLPQVKFSQRPGETVLHEIISRGYVASQGPGIAPQSGNLGFDTAMNFHKNLRHHDRLDARSEVSGTVSARCNRLMSAPSV